MKDTTDQYIRVYSPENALHNPKRFFQEMFRDLWLSRELAWRLFIRDISARYRQSILGYFWAFLPPIVSALTFILLNRSGILTTGDTRIPYPAFVMIGTLLWQAFADAINSPIKTVTAAKPMLAKINFPREAIILSGVYDVFFNFSIRLILLIAIYIYYRIIPPVTTPLVLAGIVAIVSLGFMIGLLLTPVGILYTDIGQSLAMILTFWMLITPVVYMPPSAGVLAGLSKLNPVSPLVVLTRDWLTTGTSGMLLPGLCVFLVTMVLLFAGWILYRLAMPILVERIGG